MSINKKEIFRTIKYFLVAISAAVIQMISASLLELVIFKHVIPNGETLFFVVELDKSSFLAESIGLALSIIWNFTFNRKFTFKAASNVPLSMALAFLFYVPFYPFQIWYIDTVRKALLNSLGEDFAFVIAQVTIILMNGILEFLWQRFVVFGKKVDTNAAATKEREMPHAESAVIDENSANNATVENNENFAKNENAENNENAANNENVASNLNVKNNENAEINGKTEDNEDFAHTDKAENGENVEDNESVANNENVASN